MGGKTEPCPVCGKVNTVPKSKQQLKEERRQKQDEEATKKLKEDAIKHQEELKKRHFEEESLRLQIEQNASKIIYCDICKKSLIYESYQDSYLVRTPIKNVTRFIIEDGQRFCFPCYEKTFRTDIDSIPVAIDLLKVFLPGTCDSCQKTYVIPLSEIEKPIVCSCGHIFYSPNRTTAELDSLKKILFILQVFFWFFIISLILGFIGFLISLGSNP